MSVLRAHADPLGRGNVLRALLEERQDVVDVPTYRVSANTYAIQQIAYGTGAAQNVAGAVHSSGQFSPPTSTSPPQRARIQRGEQDVWLKFADPEDLQIIYEQLIQVVPPGTALSLGKIARMFAHPLNVISVDREGGAVARIEANEELGQFDFAWLLPPGMSRGRLARVMAKAVDATAARWPERLPWVLQGEFETGVDEFGQPDGGLGACIAWQQFFAIVGIVLNITPRDTGQTILYTGGMPLADFVEAFTRFRAQGLL